MCAPLLGYVYSTTVACCMAPHPLIGLWPSGSVLYKPYSTDCPSTTCTCTSSFARFARSATSPTFTYVSNPVPDSSLCRAAAPRLRRLQLCSPMASASSAAPRLHPLRLLLPASCSRKFQYDVSNILHRVRGSVNIEVRRSRVTIV